MLIMSRRGWSNMLSADRLTPDRVRTLVVHSAGRCNGREMAHAIYAINHGESTIPIAGKKWGNTANLD